MTIYPTDIDCHSHLVHCMYYTIGFNPDLSQLLSFHQDIFNRVLMWTSSLFVCPSLWLTCGFALNSLYSTLMLTHEVFSSCLACVSINALIHHEVSGFKPKRR